MAKLYYQGHGSFRLVTKMGTVVYVDPYIGDGYDLPADLVLMTHGHGDHNHIELISQKDDCMVFDWTAALAGGEHQQTEHKDVRVRAVLANNKNHDPKSCVGFVIWMDGIAIYAAGDTSTTEDMKTLLPGLKLDYALLPIDGVYNMDAAEAADCAKLIGARHAIPIHMKPGELFDRSIAETFQAKGRIIIEPGEERTL